MYENKYVPNTSARGEMTHDLANDQNQNGKYSQSQASTFKNNKNLKLSQPQLSTYQHNRKVNWSKLIPDLNPINSCPTVGHLLKLLKKFNKKGKKEPTVLLSKLRDYTVDLPEPEVKKIWLSSLPSYLSEYLTKLPSDNLNILAQYADEFLRNPLKNEMPIPKKQKFWLLMDIVEEQKLTCTRFDPEVIELTEIMKKYNENYDKRPSNVFKHLSNTINCHQFKYKSLSDNTITEIWLSSLPDEVVSKILLLPYLDGRPLANLALTADSIFARWEETVIINNIYYCSQIQPIYETEANTLTLNNEIILKLKQGLQQYNVGTRELPSDVFLTLHGFLSWHKMYSRLTVADIREIWLTGLSKRVAAKIESLPKEFHQDMGYLVNAANRFFNERAEKNKNLSKKSKLFEVSPKICTNGPESLMNKKSNNQNVKPKTKQVNLNWTDEIFRLDNLLNDFCKVDRRPSQILTFLREETAPKFKDDFIKATWLYHLPMEFKAFLLTDSTNTLDELALNADKIYENRNKHLIGKIKLLQTTVDTLKAKLKSLNVKVDTSELNDLRSIYEKPKCSIKICTEINPNEMSICYYHREFGSASRRCVLPCYNYVFCSERKTRRKYRKKRMRAKYPVRGNFF